MVTKYTVIEKKEDGGRVEVRAKEREYKPKRTVASDFFTLDSLSTHIRNWIKN